MLAKEALHRVEIFPSHHQVVVETDDYLALCQRYRAVLYAALARRRFVYVDAHGDAGRQRRGFGRAVVRDQNLVFFRYDLRGNAVKQTGQ